MHVLVDGLIIAHASGIKRKIFGRFGSGKMMPGPGLQSGSKLMAFTENNTLLDITYPWYKESS